MELHLTQKQVANDNHDYRVVDCGRQWGKTTLAVMEMVACAFAKKDREIAYFATTFDQSRNIAWAMLKKMAHGALAKPPNESRLEIHLRTQDKGSSRITLRGFENVETARGQQFDLLVIDEVAQMRNWLYSWQAILEPTLAFRKGKALFISTPKGYNHFYEMFEKGQVENKYYKSWRFTSYDNPFLPVEKIEQAKENSTEDYFAQEYLADFRKHTGLIYKEFDRKAHMVEMPNFDSLQGPGWTYSRSIDFGYGHKSALIYFAINNNGTEIYAFDGMYKEGMTESQIAEVVKTKDAGKVITNPVADSAQPMTIQQLQEMGVSFSPIEKGPDSVKHGIAMVAQLLKVRADTGKPTLMFNKDLAWIRDEFERYSWMENKSADEGTIKEVPNKVNDDAMDAIRYFAMSYKKRQKLPEYNKNKWSI